MPTSAQRRQTLADLMRPDVIPTAGILFARRDKSSKQHLNGKQNVCHTHTHIHASARNDRVDILEERYQSFQIRSTINRRIGLRICVY